MSISSIQSLSSSYLNAFLSANPTSNTGSAASAQLEPPSDGGQMSPFAKLMSTLQQLQQSDPAKYKEVTAQIATKLQEAAKSALDNGDTKASDQLNQLAKDFSDASASGQLPNVTDLAHAVGHHHHHHHGRPPAAADGSSDTGAAASGAVSSSNSGAAQNDTTAAQLLQQLVSSLQAQSTQTSALDPMSIIGSTLAGAGIES